MAYEGGERRGDDVESGERRNEKSTGGLLARVIREAVLRGTDNPEALQTEIGEKLQAAGVNVVDELFTEPGAMSGSAFEGDSQGQMRVITDEEWESGDQQGLSSTHIKLLALGQKYPGVPVEKLRAMINESR